MQQSYYFAAIHGHHDARVHKAPMPQIGPEDLLVKMEACNLCTTDYQQWMGLRDHQGFPMAAGHEFVGIVVQKGERVSDEFQIGDRVGEMDIYCGYCDFCREGMTGDCANDPGNVLGADGFYGTKGFANYKVISQRIAMKVDKSIPAAQAAFLEPIATAVQGVKRARIRPTDTVVVVGAGTMGIVNAQVAKAWGARVLITEISEKKVRRAKEMGFAHVVNAQQEEPVQAIWDLTQGKGADIVIVAVGNTVAYRQGYAMLKPLRGRFVIFPAGYPKPELEVDPNALHYGKTELIGTFRADAQDYMDSARLLSYGLVDMQYALEGVTIPLREINHAYEAAATPDAYRVTVDLQSV